MGKTSNEHGVRFCCNVDEFDFTWYACSSFEGAERATNVGVLADALVSRSRLVLYNGASNRACNHNPASARTTHTICGCSVPFSSLSLTSRTLAFFQCLIKHAESEYVLADGAVASNNVSGTRSQHMSHSNTRDLSFSHDAPRYSAVAYSISRAGAVSSVLDSLRVSRLS
ncbi:hypothetical protein CBL_07278 [Carabus blaptoides fortunei]